MSLIGTALHQSSLVINTSHQFLNSQWQQNFKNLKPNVKF